MSVFDDLVDEIFENADLAFDAIYTPQGGSARTVRAMLSAPDVPIVGLGGGGYETRARGTALKIDLRRSETAELAEGDTIELVAGDNVPSDLIGVYTVMAPEADDSRRCWKAPLRKVPA
jgi:hypothetical protein